MKDPYATLNTYIVTTKGLATIDSDGVVFPRKVTVDIRCTSDEKGETLSMTVGNFQVAVKVKHIEKVIAEAREGAKKNE